MLFEPNNYIHLYFYRTTYELLFTELIKTSKTWDLHNKSNLVYQLQDCGFNVTLETSTKSVLSIPHQPKPRLNEKKSLLIIQGLSNSTDCLWPHVLWDFTACLFSPVHQHVFTGKIQFLVKCFWPVGEWLSEMSSRELNCNPRILV